MGPLQEPHATPGCAKSARLPSSHESAVEKDAGVGTLRNKWPRAACSAAEGGAAAGTSPNILPGCARFASAAVRQLVHKSKFGHIAQR